MTQPVDWPTRRVRVERPLLRIAERRRDCEHRHDLDPSSAKLRLYQGKRLRSDQNPGVRYEAQREPLSSAGEDSVRSSAAAGLLEQAAGLRRSIAVRAPVRRVVSALGHVHRTVEHASGGIDLAPYLPDERGSVDPVRERAANELVAKRRVSVRPSWMSRCSKPVLTGATKRTPGSRRTAETAAAGTPMATSSSPLLSSSLGSVADRANLMTSRST